METHMMTTQHGAALLKTFKIIIKNSAGVLLYQGPIRNGLSVFKCLKKMHSLDKLTFVQGVHIPGHNHNADARSVIDWNGKASL